MAELMVLICFDHNGKTVYKNFKIDWDENKKLIPDNVLLHPDYMQIVQGLAKTMNNIKLCGARLVEPEPI